MEKSNLSFLWQLDWVDKNKVEHDGSSKRNVLNFFLVLSTRVAKHRAMAAVDEGRLPAPGNKAAATTKATI